MAVFDPNDWWNFGQWFVSGTQGAARRRPAAELNQEVLHRWLMAAAFCLCFASLGPTGLIAATFATLMGIAAVASIGLALVTREHPLSPHLTAWDETWFSLTVALGLTL